MSARWAWLAAICVVACASPSPAPQPQTGGPVTVTPGPPVADSTRAGLIPAGYGSLKQDEISIVLQPNGVRVAAVPLDESIIRTLATDSYRVLRAALDSRRQQILQRGATRGVRDPRVWYVTFTGLVPDARFVPTDITVASGGRDYRPFDVLPLTPGFSEQRLQPRDVQRCLLLFDEAVDAAQAMAVSIGTERNIEWDGILQKIDAERAAVRARAGGRPDRHPER